MRNLVHPANPTDPHNAPNRNAPNEHSLPDDSHDPVGRLSQLFTIPIADIRRRLLAMLTEKSLHRGPITLASGKESHFYFDTRQTSLHPEGSFLVGRLFFDRIRELAPESEAVAGLTLGADPIVTSVTLVSFLMGTPIPALIIRKTPKSHGTMRFIEGIANVPRGGKIILLEDVITTGSSALKAAENAQNEGYAVSHILGLIDRCEGGRESVLKMGIGFDALFHREDFNV